MATANNNNGHQPNFYLTTLNDDNGDDDEDEEERPSMETLDRKIPNPFEASGGDIFFADLNVKDFT